MDVGVSGLVIFDCHFANMNLVEEVPPTTTAAQGSLAKMGVAGGLFCVARFMGRYGGSYSADMRKRFYNTTIRDCTITTNGYGDINGGALLVVDAHGYLEDVRISRVISQAIGSGSVRGSGISIADYQLSIADVVLSRTTIEENAAIATGRNGSVGEGGGIFQGAGELTMHSSTVLRGNRASHGGAQLLSGAGSATYALPAPPGHWVVGSRCSVYRTGCPRSLVGEIISPQCAANFAQCARDTRLGANATADDGSLCTPILSSQPCEWAVSPQLIGMDVHALPNGALEENYPYPCAAGILGSSESHLQGGALCAGLCPAGYTCPTLATTEPVECPAGHYCPSGSSAALPCLAGSYSNATQLQSASDCAVCPAGTSCSVGSEAPTRCLPGSVTNISRMSTCALCPGGEFQRAYGQTVCERCVPGFYCREGAAEPTPCPAGTFGNSTGLFSAGECTNAPVEFWAPLGSAVPEPCPRSGFYCPGALRDSLYGGAKPIIMPVGQSTRQEEVPALTKVMTLDMSINDFAAQREQLKIQLAARYGVHLSLITLEATRSSRRARALQTGSLELTITIATTNGGSNTVDLVTLQQSVAAVDDAALTTTISSVAVAAGLPPVTVLSQPAVTGSVRVIVPFSCPRGKWCTAGLVVDCPIGTYNPLEDQDFATSCILCPLNSNTRETNSTSRGACVCDAGFFDANASLAVDQDLINAMTTAGSVVVTMMADVVDCQACPVGTSCEQGETLEGLPLLRGYYRLDSASVDVRACPDARKNCSTSFGTPACESSSGCIGGKGESGCAPGLSGTYCEMCTPRDDGGLVFFKKSTDDDVASCEECGNNLLGTVGMGAAAAAVLAVTSLTVAMVSRRLPPSTIGALKRLNQNFTPKNKLKILVGAYQLTTKVSTVYDVSLPPDVNDFLDRISTGISFGVTGISGTSLQCLGLGGYLYQLIFWMVLPAGLVLLVVLGVAVKVALEKRKRTKINTVASSGSNDDSHGGAFHLEDNAAHLDDRPASFFEQCLPAVLTLLFFLYPLVTKTAFDGFPCYTFESGRAWLIADVSIVRAHARHPAAMFAVPALSM